MTAKFAHFAIEATDVNRAREFYTQVMGWEFRPWGPPNFYQIYGAGLLGALQERATPIPDVRKGFECSFAVSDLSQSMEAVETAGGSIADAPYEIPNVGCLVHVVDTEGNGLVLIEYEAEAALEMGIDPSDL